MVSLKLYGLCLAAVLGGFQQSFCVAQHSDHWDGEDPVIALDNYAVHTDGQPWDESNAVTPGEAGVLHLTFSKSLTKQGPPTFNKHSTFFRGWRMVDGAAYRDVGLHEITVPNPNEIDHTAYVGHGFIYIYRKEGDHYADKEIIFANSTAVTFHANASVSIRFASETLMDGDADYIAVIEPKTFKLMHYYSQQETYTTQHSKIDPSTHAAVVDTVTRFRYVTRWDFFDAPHSLQGFYELPFTTRPYSAVNCSGHGTVVNGACVCNEGWQNGPGSECSHQVCNGHGVVFKGVVCYCDSGWTFKDNHPDVDQCVRRKLPQSLIYKAGDRELLMRTTTPDMNLAKTHVKSIDVNHSHSQDPQHSSTWSEASITFPDTATPEQKRFGLDRSKSFKGVSFFDYNSGVVVGSGGKVLKTSTMGKFDSLTSTVKDRVILSSGGTFSNAGMDWVDITGDGFETLNSVVMTSSHAFVAVGENGGVLVCADARPGTNGYAGTPLFGSSKDGQVTCSGCQGQVELERVVTVQGDTTRLYAVGDKNHVRRSVNGGFTWVGLDVSGCLVSLGDNMMWHGVYFGDAEHGVIVGQQGYTCQTLDGGESWSPLPRYGKDEDIDTSDTPAQQAVYSNLHAVFGTRNYGKNQPLDKSEIAGTHAKYYDTYFVAGDKGFLCRSTDALRTCRRIPNLPKVEILSIDFHDSNTGVAVGRGGYTLYTYDNGQSWSMEGPFTRTGSPDGLTASETESITAEFYSVAMVNIHPTALQEKIVVTEDERLDRRLPALDMNGDSFRFEITTQPTKGTVTITEEVSGLYSFMPNLNKIGFTANTFGPDSFTFAVIDKWSGMSNSATVTVDIKRTYDLALIEQVAVKAAPLGVPLSTSTEPSPEFVYANAGTYYRYDTYNAFAFFTSDYAGLKFNRPSRVVAMRVSNQGGKLQKEDILVLNGDEQYVSCVAIEERSPNADVSAPGFLYLGTVTRPAKIIKVRFEVDRYDQYVWGTPPRSYDYAHKLTMTRVNAVTTASFIKDIRCMALDSTRRLGYAGLNMNPGAVVIFNMDTLAYVDILQFTTASVISMCIVDSGGVGGTGYFGALFHTRGMFVKVTNLESTGRVQHPVTFAEGNSGVLSGVFDDENKNIYLATNQMPAKILKYDASGDGAPVFVSEASLHIPGTNTSLGFPFSAGIDNTVDGGSSLGYFVARGQNNRQVDANEPARVVKIRLDDMSVEHTLALNITEKDYFPVEAVVVDPQQGYAYCATNSDPSWVLKLDI